MRPATCFDNLDFHSEFSTELNSELPNGSRYGDRVVIRRAAFTNHSRPDEEFDEKWETIPQELLYRDAVRHPQYNADPLDFLSPAEAADLPDLDFPVPDQDVIPEMVYDDVASSGAGGASNAKNASTPSTQSSAARIPEFSSSSSSPSSSFSSESAPLIPIQSSVVAHARSGKMSLAAVQERRAKNTEAARRSRARRADKIAELRQEKAELLTENAKLASENERLTRLLRALELKLSIKEEVL